MREDSEPTPLRRVCCVTTMSSMAPSPSFRRLQQLVCHVDSSDVGNSSGIVDMDFFRKNGVRVATPQPH